MTRRDLAETIRAALETGEPRQLRLALEGWEAEPLARADAEGLVAVLAGLTDVAPLVADSEDGNFFDHLAPLFQSDAADDATRLLRDRGLPELARLFDLALAGGDCHPGTLAALCGVFALYAYRPGVARVAAAVREHPDGLLRWEVVFGLFGEGNHPHGPALVEALRAPLPDGAAAGLLLELANALVRQGRLAEHPFDTPDGRARLGAWLQTEDADYAVRAEAEWALCHLRGPVG